jgi:hypothetical protein
LELPPSETSAKTSTATPTINPPRIKSVARAGERRSVR